MASTFTPWGFCLTMAQGRGPSPLREQDQWQDHSAASKSRLNSMPGLPLAPFPTMSASSNR